MHRQSFFVLVLGLSLVSGCGTDSPRRGTPEQTPSAVIGLSDHEGSELETGDPELERFLRRLTIEEEEKRAAARAAVAIARRQLADLEYRDALGTLERALILDPRHEEARALYERIQFALGDREATIGLFAGQAAEQERVRRDQLEAEIDRLYREGEELMQERRFREAAARFGRVLEQIEFYDEATERREQ